jgi:hypothetical protein
MHAVVITSIPFCMSSPRYTHIIHLASFVTTLLTTYTMVFVFPADILKGKAIPLQAWTGPEGSRRLRLPDFKKIST